MKQKHAELIHKWADGAVIQYLNPNNEWKDTLNNNPTWNAGETYRVKPVLAAWQVKLIKAIKNGEEVEYFYHDSGWTKARALHHHVSHNTTDYIWSTPGYYRIVEPNVYMWAYLIDGDWYAQSKLMTETQARTELLKTAGVEKIKKLHTFPNP